MKNGQPGTSLKAARSLQIIDFLVLAGQTKWSVVESTKLVFNQQAYKTGKPNLAACNRVFKLVMKGKQPHNFVGKPREPNKSKKLKRLH
jgi:hypothetical protein